MGAFYERVQKADAVHHDSRTYGQMPKLWRQYGGKDLGETVCERVISAANNVRHAESGVAERVRSPCVGHLLRFRLLGSR
jgi:hypothetical protein